MSTKDFSNNLPTSTFEEPVEPPKRTESDEAPLELVHLHGTGYDDEKSRLQGDLPRVISKCIQGSLPSGRTHTISGVGTSAGQLEGPAWIRKPMFSLVDYFDKLLGFTMPEKIASAWTYTETCAENTEFMFMGCSRGGFSVQVLAQLVEHCGYGHQWENPKDVTKCFARGRPLPTPSSDAKIRALYALDPVGTYNGIATPAKFFGFRSDKFAQKAVQHARVMLMFDEKRKLFKPNVFRGDLSECAALKQIWFEGVHGDAWGPSILSLHVIAFLLHDLGQLQGVTVDLRPLTKVFRKWSNVRYSRLSKHLAWWRGGPRSKAPVMGTYHEFRHESLVKGNRMKTRLASKRSAFWKRFLKGTRRRESEPAVDCERRDEGGTHSRTFKHLAFLKKVWKRTKLHDPAPVNDPEPGHESSAGRNHSRTSKHLAFLKKVCKRTKRQDPAPANSPEPLHESSAVDRTSKYLAFWKTLLKRTKRQEPTPADNCQPHHESLASDNHNIFVAFLKRVWKKIRCREPMQGEDVEPRHESLAKDNSDRASTHLAFLKRVWKKARCQESVPGEDCEPRHESLENGSYDDKYSRPQKETEILAMLMVLVKPDEIHSDEDILTAARDFCVPKLDEWIRSGRDGLVDVATVAKAKLMEQLALSSPPTTAIDQYEGNRQDFDTSDAGPSRDYAVAIVALSNSKEQDNLKEDPGTGPSIAATASKVTLSGSVVNSSQRSQTSAPSAAPSDDMQGNARSSVTIKTRADSDKRNITAVAEATLPKLDHADPYSPHSPNAMDSGDKIPRDLTISEEAQGIVNASAKNVAPADEVARSKSKEELAAESPSPSLNAEDEAALDTEDLEATKRHEDIGLDRIAVDIKAESFKSVDQQTTKKWKENGHCDIDADAGVALLKSNEIENEKKGLGTVTGRIEDGERMPSSKLE